MSWLNAITEYTLQLIKELRNNSYQGKIFVSVRNEKNTGMFNLSMEYCLLMKMAASNFFNTCLLNLTEETKEN